MVLFLVFACFISDPGSVLCANKKSKNLVALSLEMMICFSPCVPVRQDGLPPAAPHHQGQEGILQAGAQATTRLEKSRNRRRKDDMSSKFKRRMLRKSCRENPRN